jgi:hypothetical protein
MCGDGKEAYRPGSQQARSDRQLLKAARDLWEKRNQELDADE